jgi:hypothetical protein
MRALLSYHYFKKKDISKLVEDLSMDDQPIDIMVDSGAFSAFTLGSVIDLDEYAEWVRYWGKYFTAYANLDVIGDPRATRDNQRALEAKGLAPLPVFHTGEPWEVLDGYLERYSYIMLGGMVPYVGQKNRLMPWLIKCFKKAEGRAVYHGLGLTSWYGLNSLPWYSVDSSTWNTGIRYGQPPIFNPKTGTITQIPLGRRRDLWEAHRHIINGMGFWSSEFSNDRHPSKERIVDLSCSTFQLVEEWLRKRHGVIRIPGRQASDGLRIYLAGVT